MKTVLTYLLCTIIFIPVFANGPDVKTIESEIKSVTVFLQGAQVHREAEVTLKKGRNKLLLKGLSPKLEKESIQLKGEGDFMLVSVVHQLDVLGKAPSRNEITELIQQQLVIKDSLEFIDMQLNVLNEEAQLLLANKKLGGSQQGVAIENLQAASQLFRERLGEIKFNQLKLGRIKRKLENELVELNKQQVVLHGREPQPTSKILVEIEANKAIATKLLISYLVKEAGWLPAYDLRVENLNEPLVLTYKARVFQQSEENWKNVKLTISSGNPKEGGSKPILQPWQLGYYSELERQQRIQAQEIRANGNQVYGKVIDEEGMPLIGATVRVEGTTIGTITDVNGEYSLIVPENSKQLSTSYLGYSPQKTNIVIGYLPIQLASEVALMEEVVIAGNSPISSQALTGTTSGVKIRGASSFRNPRFEIEQKPKPLPVKQVIRPTTFSLEIELPYTIPSDGQQYTVDMITYDVPAYYEHYCAPKLDTDVFLTAQLTEWEEMNLLDGEASLFLEGTYLGKSLLDMRNVEDTLIVSLGRDKGVVVSREKLEEKSGKRILGNNQREQVEWLIKVRNNKAQSVNLVLEDQFPVSRYKEIQVLDQIAEGAMVDEKSGLAQWKLMLQPSEQVEKRLQFMVKYPVGKQIWLD